MNNTQIFFGLNTTQWTAIVALLLLLIFVLIIFSVLNGPRRSNKNIIKIKGNNDGDIKIDQRDQSRHQTTVNLNVKATPSPAPKSVPSKGPPADGAFLFLGAIAFCALILFYARYFDVILIWTRAWYVFLVGACVTLPAATLFGWFSRAPQVLMRVGIVFVLSVLSAFFLLDAQTLIHPNLVKLANDLPLSTHGVMLFIKTIWGTQWLWFTAASVAICLFAMFVAFLLTLLLGRTVKLALADLRYAGNAGDLSEHLPSWGNFGLASLFLVVMAGLRYVWLPHALLNS
jgi:hypothetical protein